MVVAFDTREPPHAISAVLSRIESDLGRVRTADRFVSRTIDLDVLLYGDGVVEDDDLSLPREEIPYHEFVLGPLAEICGALEHPVLNRSIADLWETWKRTHRVTLRAVSAPGAEAASAVHRQNLSG